MTVRTPNLPGTGSMACSGAPWQMRQTCSWMDRHGRPVSPPLEYSKSKIGHRTSSKDRSVRRVSIEFLCLTSQLQPVPFIVKLTGISG